jgi:hypothetical protein
MHGVFDDGDLEPRERRRDTELTLGPVMLLFIFFSLVLICGLFFGLGYSMGRRSAQQSAAAGSQQPTTGTPSSLQAEGSRPKPSATPQTNPATSTGAQVDVPASTPLDAQQVSAPQGAEPSTPPVSPPAQSQARPVLPAPANPPQPAPPAAAPRGDSGIAPPGAPMVQIAAVSHPEDADVLVYALRKRGYAVVARREAADGLIHVRIGPFASRDEANRWRQKLLNDGYNAILQP